ncbi:GNAT family N-acetyltransferase [Kineosporia sp. J2-2]|uniref:GNAT family N-acetyltransferase n=1 Tax=Kineosporia corallincola TaxID=2835133 RepID=A0ABS5TR70_9ACTN|nr:GNAT family N-acetyltransferase [Kineosporia corallincola]MBT0772764.1 GNAT family N-acetyltransferase [Kineosporia corallincola]
MKIRAFEDTDWPAVYEIVREVIDGGETYAYDPDWTEQRTREVWVEPAPSITVVAVHDDGTVLGTAHSGPNRPGRGSHVATASFMVSSKARGQGVGRALGEYVLAWARSGGYHGMQFNAVVETNTVAVKLWQSLGFATIGIVPEAFDSKAHGLVGLHVMYQKF